MTSQINEPMISQLVSKTKIISITKHMLKCDRHILNILKCDTFLKVP